MIDLHSHTVASDGQHTADELFQMAKAAGVHTLAVTDHDTVDGLKACEDAAQKHGLTLVPGIELSAFINSKEVHVLGHFVDRTEAGISSFSEKLRGERRKRMEQMVVKMQGLGFPVTMEQVLGIAGDAHLARPHLARVLVELNYCTSTKEAFDRFLGDKRPAAVGRFQLSAEDAIAIIRQAKGAATLAHPGVSRVERFEVEKMAKAGLVGLEAEHSDHPPTMRDKFRSWAKDFNLVSTSGSDFHGEKVAPGRKLGTESMAPEALATLRSRVG
ncbi:MAG: PHP domain-containing protein [Myxococcaceae bacterium]